MVYAEAYFMCNAIFCACALPLGGRLAGLPAPKGQVLLLSALLGAALCIPVLYASWMGMMALLSLPVCVWLCFGRHGRRACTRCTLMTFAASALLGGAMLAMMNAGLHAVPAMLASALLSLFTYLLATLLPTTLQEVRQVELTVEDSSVLLPAMIDSGNLLRDPVTALPVLVVPRRAMALLFPEVGDWSDLSGLPFGFRLLCVRTAAGGGLMPMFRPDRCRLFLNGRICEVELLVAVAGCDYGGVQALVPMAALPRDHLS